MQSDQKAIGVSYGVLITLGVAVLLFTVYMLLKVPSMLQTTGSGEGETEPSVANPHSSETATASNKTRAAQQLVQYRQRVAVLSEQVTRYQQQIEALSRQPGNGRGSSPTSPDTDSLPTTSGNPRGAGSSPPPPGLSSELATINSQLDAAQDAQEDLLTENLRLQRELEELANDLALLAEVNQSIQEGAERRHGISIEAAAATLSRVEESPIPYLIECLDDEDVEVQIWGAAVLAQLGPGANEALPALQQLLLVDDELLRMAVVRAIDAIDGE